jgi:hypothetical protein
MIGQMIALASALLVAVLAYGAAVMAEPTTAPIPDGGR